MAWQSVEVRFAGAVHKGRYRTVANMIEVEGRAGRRQDVKGPLRTDVAAAAILKRLVQQATAVAG